MEAIGEFLVGQLRCLIAENAKLSAEVADLKQKLHGNAKPERKYVHARSLKELREDSLCTPTTDEFEDLPF